jgi:hypothetical protein
MVTPTRIRWLARLFQGSDEDTDAAREAAGAAARSLLEDIHGQVRATLKRIDASLTEIRARERALTDGTFRAQVRKETQAWFETHPHQARAIAELFAQGAGA